MPIFRFSSGFWLFVGEDNRLIGPGDDLSCQNILDKILYDFYFVSTSQGGTAKTVSHDEFVPLYSVGRVISWRRRTEVRV